MSGFVGWAIVGISGLALAIIGLATIAITLYAEYLGARIFLDDPSWGTFVEGGFTMVITAAVAGGVVSLLAIPFGLLMDAGAKLVDRPADRL